MGSDPTGQQFACLFDTGAEISIMNSNGPQFEHMEKWMKTNLLHPLSDDQAIQGITGSTTLANMYAIPLTFANSTLPSQSITIPARAAHLTQAVDIIIGLDLIILHEITLHPAQSKTSITKYAVPFQERFTDRTPIEITSVPIEGCYGQQLRPTLPLAYPVPTDLPELTYTVESPSPQSSPQMPNAPERPRPASAKPPKLPKRKQAMHFSKPTDKNHQRTRSEQKSRNNPFPPDDRVFATNRTYASGPNWTEPPRRHHTRPPTVTHGIPTRPKPKQTKPPGKRTELRTSERTNTALVYALRNTALTLILTVTTVILLGLYKLQLTIHIQW